MLFSVGILVLFFSNLSSESHQWLLPHFWKTRMAVLLLWPQLLLMAIHVSHRLIMHMDCMPSLLLSCFLGYLYLFQCHSVSSSFQVFLYLSFHCSYAWIASLLYIYWGVGLFGYFVLDTLVLVINTSLSLNHHCVQVNVSNGNCIFSVRVMAGMVQVLAYFMDVLMHICLCCSFI